MYRDMWQAAKATYAAGGVRGLYCGFGATLLRDVPEMAIQVRSCRGIDCLNCVGFGDASAQHGTSWPGVCRHLFKLQKMAFSRFASLLFQLIDSHLLA